MSSAVASNRRANREEAEGMINDTLSTNLPKGTTRSSLPLIRTDEGKDSSKDDAEKKCGKQCANKCSSWLLGVTETQKGRDAPKTP
mmetsp:Transcript_34088/g.68707  ORF Transcript_34088/g.68707 Transcript_34088/m.68707 type:complete len:86 (+) Transcript_34088:1203-1460(+)